MQNWWMTDGYSRVAGLRDIPETPDWWTFLSCGTDGHSRVAGQMDIPELRDRWTFHICGTDGHSRVAGPMDHPELKDLWIFQSCVFSIYVLTSFSPSNTVTLMRQRFCSIYDAIVQDSIPNAFHSWIQNFNSHIISYHFTTQQSISFKFLYISLHNHDFFK